MEELQQQQHQKRATSAISAGVDSSSYRLNRSQDAFSSTQQIRMKKDASKGSSRSKTSKQRGRKGKAGHAETKKKGGGPIANYQSDPDDQQLKYFCIFPNNGYNLIRNVMLQKEGWREVKKDEVWKVMGMSVQTNSHPVNFIWKPTNFNYKMYCNIDNAQHIGHMFYQMTKSTKKELVVNHLEGHRDLTTKTGLIRSLKYYYKDNTSFIDSNYQVFDSIPTSFVVSSKLETYEYHQFIKRFQDLEKGEGSTVKEKVPQKQCLKNMWLVKPANENQGKGIKIFDDLNQIIRFLESSLKFSYWVIQKYLEKPLLFKNRKFDIRMWAFAHSNLDFYFYDEGYIRTSSQTFNIDDPQDEFTHLTNNCLQIKNKEMYGMHEEGNTISFAQFQAYLDETYPEHSLNFKNDFIRRMKDLAIDCFLSCKTTLNPNKRKNSFEFFGFDFMIDEDFRVWLIEVNTNPYIGIHNKGMKHIIPEMFHGLFKIVLDPVFENMTSSQIEKINEGTKFDLLYSRLRGINKRRPPQEGIYPIKALDKRKIYPKKFKPKKHKQRNNPYDLLSQQPIINIDETVTPQKPATDKLDDSAKIQARQQSEQQALPKKLSPNVPQSRTQRKWSQKKDHSSGYLSNGRPTPGGRNLTTTAPPKQQSSILQIPEEAIQADDDSQSSNDLKQSHSVTRILSKTDLEVDVSLKNQKTQQKPLKPVKSIVQQVKNLDKKSQFIKLQVQEILNRIVATLKSWELFSDQQILDANTALKMIQQALAFNPEQQSLILDQILALIGSNEVPINIRIQLATNIGLIFKNKGLLKEMLAEPKRAELQLRYLYDVIIESCQDKVEQQDPIIETTTQQEDLVMECISILLQVLQLNDRKYYIPGETVEKTKLRQRAIDSGILIVLMAKYFDVISTKGALKTILKEEFLEKIEIPDIEYHFNNNHALYDKFQNVVTNSELKQKIDTSLSKRLTLMKDRIEREQKQLEDKRKEEERRERDIKMQFDAAILERRKLAEKRMQQRIQHLQKIQNDQMKLELQIKEQQDRENEVRKQEMQEQLKRKQEQRRQQYLSNLKKKRQEEREEEEEKQRKKMERDEIRRVALDEWHKNKRDQERKKSLSNQKYFMKRPNQNENSHSSLSNFINSSAPQSTKKKSTTSRKTSTNMNMSLQATIQKKAGFLLDHEALKNTKISDLNKIHKNIQYLRVNQEMVQKQQQHQLALSHLPSSNATVFQANQSSLMVGSIEGSLGGLSNENSLSRVGSQLPVTQIQSQQFRPQHQSFSSAELRADNIADNIDKTAEALSEKEEEESRAPKSKFDLNDEELTSLQQADILNKEYQVAQMNQTHEGGRESKFLRNNNDQTFDIAERMNRSAYDHELGSQPGSGLLRSQAETPNKSNQSKRASKRRKSAFKNTKQMELLEEQSIIYRQKIYNEYSKSSKASKAKKGNKPFQLPHSEIKFMKEDKEAQYAAKSMATSKLKNNNLSPFSKFSGSATPVSPVSPQIHYRNQQVTSSIEDAQLELAGQKHSSIDRVSKMLPTKGSSFIVSEHSIQYDINKKSRLKAKNTAGPGADLSSLDVKMQNTDSMYHLPNRGLDDESKVRKQQKSHNRLNLPTEVSILEEDSSSKMPLISSNNVKIQDESNEDIMAGPSAKLGYLDKLSLSPRFQLPHQAVRQELHKKQKPGKFTDPNVIKIKNQDKSQRPYDRGDPSFPADANGTLSNFERNSRDKAQGSNLKHYLSIQPEMYTPKPQQKLADEGSAHDRKKKSDLLGKQSHRQANDLPPIKNLGAYTNIDSSGLRKDTDNSSRAPQQSIYSSVAKKDFKRLYDSSSIAQFKNQTKYSSFQLKDKLLNPSQNSTQKLQPLGPEKLKYKQINNNKRFSSSDPHFQQEFSHQNLSLSPEASGGADHRNERGVIERIAEGESSKPKRFGGDSANRRRRSSQASNGHSKGKKPAGYIYQQHQGAQAAKPMKPSKQPDTKLQMPQIGGNGELQKKQALLLKEASMEYRTMGDESNSPDRLPQALASHIGEKTLKQNETKSTVKENEPEIGGRLYNFKAPNGNDSGAQKAESKSPQEKNITIINNDFSQINITQNINIEKYVKKKKHRRKNAQSEHFDSHISVNQIQKLLQNHLPPAQGPKGPTFVLDDKVIGLQTLQQHIQELQEQEDTKQKQQAQLLDQLLKKVQKNSTTNKKKIRTSKISNHHQRDGSQPAKEYIHQIYSLDQANPNGSNEPARPSGKSKGVPSVGTSVQSAEKKREGMPHHPYETTKPERGEARYTTSKGKHKRGTSHNPPSTLPKKGADRIVATEQSFQQNKSPNLNEEPSQFYIETQVVAMSASGTRSRSALRNRGYPSAQLGVSTGDVAGYPRGQNEEDELEKLKRSSSIREEFEKWKNQSPEMTVKESVQRAKANKSQERHPYQNLKSISECKLEKIEATGARLTRGGTQLEKKDLSTQLMMSIPYQLNLDQDRASYKS